MKVSCTQENLQKAIGTVSRVIGHRGTLPILNNILLKVEEGQLKVAATDLEIGIVTYCGAKVDEEGSITIPARLLGEFVSANPDKTIDLTVEGTKIKASSAHVTAHLHGLDSNDFPVIPEVKSPDPITISASNFKQAISQVAFAAALDETRPVLTAVNFIFKEKTLLLVATDSYRLAEKTIPLEKPVTKPFNVLVPARTLGEVGRLLDVGDGTVTLSVAENQIGFSMGQTTVVSRVLDGVFPDYEQIIPKEHTTTVTLVSSELQNALKLAASFAREVANNIRVVIDSEKPLQVIATSPQVGDTTTSLESAIEGEAIEIAFNAKYLLDMVSACQSQKIKLLCNGPLTAAIITPDKGSDYRALVMPLRLDE